MQMNDAGVVVRAVCRLVQPLAVQRQRRTALAEPAGGLDDVPGANAAYFGHCFRGVALDDLGQWREAVGVARDVVRIDKAFGNEYMQHAVEQRDVGTRFDGQVQVGDLGRLRPAGVGDDDFQVGIGCPGIFDHAEYNRVGNRRICPGDENHLGLPYILVTARRRIGAQGLLVTRHRRGHAQAGIGIDVVGADQSLGQFVEDVIVLGHQLAGNIEGDGIRAMLADACSKSVGCRVERLIPANALAGLPTPRPMLRIEEARGRIGG